MLLDQALDNAGQGNPNATPNEVVATTKRILIHASSGRPVQGFPPRIGVSNGHCKLALDNKLALTRKAAYNFPRAC